jgi:hypothetical protein
LLLTIKIGAADIFIDRQAVAWGSGRLFNPTDVVTPYAFNELDKEERLGVDAVRVRVTLCRMGNFPACPINPPFFSHLGSKKEKCIDNVWIMKYTWKGGKNDSSVCNINNKNKQIFNSK